MFASIMLVITIIGLLYLNAKLDKMIEDGSYAEK